MGTCEEWPYVEIVRAGRKREDIREIQNIRAGANGIGNTRNWGGVIRRHALRVEHAWEMVDRHV